MKTISTVDTPRTPTEGRSRSTRTTVSSQGDRRARRADRPAGGGALCTPVEQRAQAAAPVFVAAAPTTLQVRELAAKVAVLETPVLIVGESGVGKNALAQFIHHRSGRLASELYKVHCSTAEPQQLAAEIFGDRTSREAALAREGTLVLDDIGGLSTELQSRLLRAMEEGSFVPADGEPTPVRARILATATPELERSVTEGSFRRDLYWRLRPIRLGIAPLRERRADIPKLCEHFLEASRSSGVEIPERLMEGFLRYDWPGNVRELAQAVERFILLPDTDAALEELEQQPLRTAPRRHPVPAAAGLAANGHGDLRGRRDGHGFGERQHASNGAVDGAAREPHARHDAARFVGGHEPSDNGLDGSAIDGHGANGHSPDGHAVDGRAIDGHRPASFGAVRDQGGDRLEFELLERDEKGRIQLKAIAARAAEEAEKRVILDVLEKVHWNRKRAASRMDICYKTLLNKLERWELNQ